MNTGRVDDEFTLHVPVTGPARQRTRADPAGCEYVMN